jgi:hypothetical protein
MRNLFIACFFAISPTLLAPIGAYTQTVSSIQQASEPNQSSSPPTKLPNDQEEADDGITDEDESEISVQADESQEESSGTDPQQQSANPPQSNQEQTDSEEGPVAADEDKDLRTTLRKDEIVDFTALNLPSLPANPSQIGTYRRDYEGDSTPAERNYELMLESNFQAALNRHPFEGPWVLEIEGHTQSLRFEIRQNDKNKNRIDGAWHGDRSEYGAYGLLSDSSLVDDYLEINYKSPGEASPSILMMRADGKGRYIGHLLNPEGQIKSATLKRLYRP